MKSKKFKKQPEPIIAVDTSLDKYETQILFPEKLEKANKALATKGLPKTTEPSKN